MIAGIVHAWRSGGKLDGALGKVITQIERSRWNGRGCLPKFARDSRAMRDSSNGIISGFERA